MAGVKGKTGQGQEGNDKARKHGFYSADMGDEEAAIYDEAKTVSLLEEVALCRTRLKRLHKWAQDPDNEITDGTLYQMDRMLSRVGDLTTKVSIIERNRIESGAGVDEALDRTIEVLERTGAHRATFKTNGKSNGKVTNGNGTG